MPLFDVHTYRRDKIDWDETPLNETNHSGLILPDAYVANMRGGFGKISFQGLQSEDEYAIWMSSYRMRDTAGFISESLNSSFELNVLLNNAVEHTLFGHIHQSIAAQQYNLFYLPYIKNEIVLYKGQHYDTLDVHFTLHYIERLLPHYPDIIGPMLDKAYKGEGVSFLPGAIFLSEDQRALGRHILNFISRKLTDKYYLNIVIELFLIAALINRYPNTETKILTLEEEESLALAHEKLMSDFSEFATIKELAKIAHMNTDKFLKSFKYKYNKPPQHYWNEFRLDRALELLIHTSMPVTEISNTLGFQTVRGFEKAFQSRYYLNPGQIRKRTG